MVKARRFAGGARLVFRGALLFGSLILQGCDGSSSGNGNITATPDGPIDITNAIFSERSVNCADYVNELIASVLDITRDIGFEASVQISQTDTTCSFVSNGIPNHDFNDATAHFATDVTTQNQKFTVTKSPAIAAHVTPLSQTITNAIFLNGVVLDILSAGCYKPSSPNARPDGNVAIGCGANAAWLQDPLGTRGKFGADAHNAHTQPGGLYHYHGNPKAMFDDNPGPHGSPVIGFAADGFPIYGSYFYDDSTGAVRKAVSGYTLKQGARVAIGGLNPSDNPENSANYDGSYVADWEFTAAGDLDACNGMIVNGHYGYYAIDSYPWVMTCFTGTPDPSFNKF
jgi:hypothetical protein